jgi:glycosyltransferase involved in cell wall biosynthesis
METTAFGGAEKHLNDPRFVICAHLGVSLQDIVLVCIARLAAVKRIDMLLDAIHIVSGEFHSCKCIIVGNGPLQEELMAKRDRLMSDKSVLFVGFVEDIRPYMETSDVFVVYSDNDFFH